MYKLCSLLLYLVLFSNIAAAQQKSFTLSGTIQGKTGAYIFLNYPQDAAGTNKKDSSLIVNGQFLFKGKFSGPAAEATLSLSRQGGISDTSIRLFLVPGDLQLTLDYPNFKKRSVLKGSPVHLQAEALEKSKSFISAQQNLLLDAMRKAYRIYKEAVKAKKDEAIVDCLKEASDGMKLAMNPLQKQLIKMDLAFMDEHPTSFITAFMMRAHITYMSLKEAQERYNKLPEEIKNIYIGKTIRKGLDELARGSTGAKAFQFASTELRGGELKLSDYKGRYVLLDFWASWCVPCRKGNPHLLSLYAKYKDKGLEIIGIADNDGSPGAWKKAVEKDGIGVWKHVLRGLKRSPNGGYDHSSSISDQYGTASLPTKILIDPQGMIIGRYAADAETDEALDKKLAALFGF